MVMFKKCQIFLKTNDLEKKFPHMWPCGKVLMSMLAVSGCIWDIWVKQRQIESIYPRED